MKIKIRFPTKNIRGGGIKNNSPLGSIYFSFRVLDFNLWGNKEGKILGKKQMKGCMVNENIF